MEKCQEAIETAADRTWVTATETVNTLRRQNQENLWVDCGLRFKKNEESEEQRPDFHLSNLDDQAGIN